MKNQESNVEFITRIMEGLAVPGGTKNLLPKYGEHLKLLWERGLVKYDGAEYYL